MLMSIGKILIYLTLTFDLKVIAVISTFYCHLQTINEFPQSKDEGGVCITSSDGLMIDYNRKSVVLCIQFQLSIVKLTIDFNHNRIFFFKNTK